MDMPIYGMFLLLALTIFVGYNYLGGVMFSEKKVMTRRDGWVIFAHALASIAVLVAIAEGERVILYERFHWNIFLCAAIVALVWVIHVAHMMLLGAKLSRQAQPKRGKLA